MTVLAGAVSAAVSLVVVLVIERRASALGLLDHPNDRSSHLVARPRGGGLGILFGTAAGLAVAMLGTNLRVDPGLWSVIGASVLVASVGLRDDLSPLGVAPRLIAQILAACLVVTACGGLTHLPLPAPLDVPLGGLGAVLAVIWLIGVTNFFNFMDGADGLAGGQACVTFGLLAWALWPLPQGQLALLVVAASAAFLMRNWAPARIFLGDIGSGWLGFLLAALPLAGPPDRHEDLVLLVATSLALFLIDPLLTLVRRFARGAPLTASHREHAYQRLVRPNVSHGPAVAGLLAGAVLLSVLAGLAYRDAALAWPALLVALAVAAVEWRIASIAAVPTGPDR